MPRIDISKLPARWGSIGYPDVYKPVVAGREKIALGDAVGLTQFGVNLTRLKPGAATALRHWHEHEDEFVYILEGEVVLVEDEGETVLKPGECAGFKAGIPNGHNLINRTDRDALMLEVGTRAPRERAHYPDVDLVYEVDDEAGSRNVLHKDGTPY
jgi:uncharacterized cupin superfamily protein